MSAAARVRRPPQRLDRFQSRDFAVIRSSGPATTCERRKRAWYKRVVKPSTLARVEVPMSKYSLTHLSDGNLLRDLTALVARDRATTAELLAHLAEVDARKLYLSAGYPSMHAYCEQELRLSEDAANKRIRVARKAREIPALFAAIADGRIHLSGVILLASSLTAENADELIEAAAGKSKGQIEALIAARTPRSEEFPIVESFKVDQQTAEPVATTGTSSIAEAARNQPGPGASCSCSQAIESRADRPGAICAPRLP